MASDPTADMGRRDLLKALGAGAALLATPWVSSPVYAEDGVAVFYAADRRPDGSFAFAGFDAGGRLRFEVALPGRAHDAAVRPGAREVVVLARRPGRFALVVDSLDGRPLHELSSAEGRHFYGHGVFSPDGRWFYTGENDYDGQRGAIGVRDAGQGYRQVGEIPSHGLCPHQLAFLPDGRTLACANGGLLTHPARGRLNLNIETMQPSLCLVDAASGELRREARLAPELHKAGTRHLAVSPQGQIAVAMQYVGAPEDAVPLLALDDGDGLVPLLPPEAVRRRQRQYAGAVAYDAGGRYVAVSHPRGGLITLWDGAEKRFLGSHRIADGCGLAPTARPGTFLVTAGNGELRLLDAASGEAEAFDLPDLAARAWDNHIARG